MKRVLVMAGLALGLLGCANASDVTSKAADTGIVRQFDAPHEKRFGLQAAGSESHFASTLVAKMDLALATPKPVQQ